MSTRRSSNSPARPAPKPTPVPAPEPVPALKFMADQAQAASLIDWWMAQAANEIHDLAQKATIYGSNSLAEMGKVLLKAQGRTDVDEDELLEAGCFLYAYGKMQRWADAVLRGERPNEDTIHDLKVYSMMAEKIRATGTWP